MRFPAPLHPGVLIKRYKRFLADVTLDTGDTRTFLEDGDTLTLRGAAMGDGFRVGFGECAGKLLPAPEIS